MFSLRHVKAIVLIVGVLAVGFGMYIAFQIQEAEAHTPSSCDVRPMSLLNGCNRPPSPPSGLAPDGAMHPSEDPMSLPYDHEPILPSYSHDTSIRKSQL